jgi:hypothetical protein
MMVLLASEAFAQQNQSVPVNPIELRRKFTTTLNELEKPFLTGSQQRYHAAIERLDSTETGVKKGIESVHTSLLSEHQRLDRRRKDTLKGLAARLVKNYTDSVKASHNAFRKTFDAFTKDHSAIRKYAGACSDCNAQENFNAMALWYRDTVDMLFHRFAERVAEINDGAESFAGEVLEKGTNELTALCEQLAERRDVEIEAEETHAQSIADSLAREHERASRVVLTTDYISRLTYRGRDGGIEQYAFSPMLTFRHGIGVSASVGGAWVSESANKWDATIASIMYELPPLSNFSSAVSYAHTFFSDSTMQSQAEVNNALGLSASFDALWFTIGGMFDYAFGTGSEISLALDISKYIDLTTFTGGHRLSVSPSFLALYGEQDLTLVNKRLARAANNAQAKGKGSTKQTTTTTTSSSKSVFGIMDYQIGIALNFTYSFVSVRPVFTYDIPMNVIDGSDAADFGSFRIEMSLTFR